LINTVGINLSEYDARSKNKEKLIGYQLQSSWILEYLIGQLILNSKPQDIIFMRDSNYADICQECYLQKDF